MSSIVETHKGMAKHNFISDESIVDQIILSLATMKIAFKFLNSFERNMNKMWNHMEQPINRMKEHVRDFKFPKNSCCVTHF
jgi:hypothetical protein